MMMTGTVTRPLSYVAHLFSLSLTMSPSLSITHLLVLYVVHSVLSPIYSLFLFSTSPTFSYYSVHAAFGKVTKGFCRTKSNGQFAALTFLSLPAIFGHKQVTSPGNNGFIRPPGLLILNFLPTLLAAASHRLLIPPHILNRIFLQCSSNSQTSWNFILKSFSMHL